MSQRSSPRVLLGSLFFLVLAPGTVAGLIPFWLTRRRGDTPNVDASVLGLAGAAMALAGLASLLDSFGRFVFVGLGTPAPVAPPTRLVVSGQYRYVRNPMYVAVLVIVLGQGLVLGSSVLLGYAALLWLLFHIFVVLYEEPTLALRFGAPYRVYCQNVRRWWPRVRPWHARRSSGKGTAPGEGDPGRAGEHGDRVMPSCRGHPSRHPRVANAVTGAVPKERGRGSAGR